MGVGVGGGHSDVELKEEIDMHSFSNYHDRSRSLSQGLAPSSSFLSFIRFTHSLFRLRLLRKACAFIST